MPAQTEVASFEEKLARIQAFYGDAHETAVRTMTEQESKLSALGAQLQEQSSDNEKLRSQLTAATKKATTLNEPVAQASVMIQTSFSPVDALRQVNDRLSVVETMNDVCLATIDKLTKKNEPIGYPLNAMKAKIKTLDENVAALQAALNNTSKNKTCYEQKCTVLSQKVDDLNAQISSSGQAHGQMISLNERLLHDVANLRRQLADAQQGATHRAVPPPSVSNGSGASFWEESDLSLFQKPPGLLINQDVVSFNALMPEEMALLQPNFFGDTFS
ncbi:MAG: hypothetical protein COB66_04445 [Coxiella sp. (in: Bacteria)]|nr:MAG: hypothetical protein COB66_04445 [Coxiella sp. (in: g-proteobacteria)]